MGEVRNQRGEQVGEGLRFDREHKDLREAGDRDVVGRGGGTGGLGEGLAGGGDRVTGEQSLGGAEPSRDPALRQGRGHLAGAHKANGQGGRNAHGGEGGRKRGRGWGPGPGNGRKPRRGAVARRLRGV